VTPGIEQDPEALEQPPPPLAFAVTRRGFGFRFSLHQHKEPSTRAGRQFARPFEGDEVVGVALAEGDETVLVVSRDSHVLTCPVAEVNVLSGPGKGVTIIKLSDDDVVVGWRLSKGARDGLHVVNSRGTRMLVTAMRKTTARGGKGQRLFARETIREVETLPVEVVSLAAEEQG
jgi:DNA gyrase subunit A